MANTETYIRRAEFIFKEEITICNLFIEFIPDNIPVGWGSGWRTKTFPASRTAVDIMNKDCDSYLDWAIGREE